MGSNSAVKRFLHRIQRSLNSQTIVKEASTSLFKPPLKQASTKLLIIKPRQWGCHPKLAWVRNERPVRMRRAGHA